MRRRRGIPLEGVFEHAGLLLVGLDGEGRIVHFNAAAERLSGYSIQEVMGKHLWDFAIADDAREACKSYLQSFRDGRVVDTLEQYLLTKDGSRRLISWRASALSRGKRRSPVILAVGMDITERRIAEDAMASREGFFRMLIENALDLVTVLGSDGRVIYVGPAVKRLLGYAQEELISRNIIEFIHPDDKVAAKAGLDFALTRAGITGDIELRIRDREGGWRIHEATSFNLLDDPLVKGVVINSRDITDRKEAEEELSLRNREIEAIFQALPDIFFRIGADGTILDYGSGRSTYLYAPPEEFVRKKVREVLPPEVAEVTERSVREVIEGGKPVSFEYDLPFPGGSRRFEARMLPVLEKEVITVVRDVTERAALISSLLESEENYRVTFESTGSAMVVLGLDGTILDTNQEIQKLLGYSREEVVGRKKYMEFVHPEDRENVKRYSLRLLKGELKGPARYEARTVRRDGRVLNTIINVSVLPGMGKSVASLVDITEKKNYELELEARAAQLRDFLDIAAHELRHPATLIEGYAMTLADFGGEMSPDELTRALSAIVRSVDKLTGVVDDLLDVSRIERGFMSLERGEHDVLPLLRGAVHDMAARKGGRAIEITSVEDPGPVWVDPEKFTRLMVILLDNAVKYSPPGSLVEVNLGIDGDNALFSVLDRGTGIPDRERSRVFDRFYQSDEVLHHSSPGLGLGLYIAKRIVEAHGGRIWCEAREVGGSAFRFTLPLRGDDATT
ncbi:MAG: PAS domain S-box protein [Actinomycetota bacterium]|nr:PAS domain S-box protein [Actinomycetota bacterium]MDD5666710.1 PAS domain S-box protein [Actinomycetota bacterium]